MRDDEQQQISVYGVHEETEPLGPTRQAFGNSINTRKGLSWIPRTASVYFLASHDLTKVKIGKARNPRKRILDLRRANPYELVILLTVPGYTIIETWFHERFRSLRYHCEWFHHEGELAVTIEGLKAGTINMNDFCFNYQSRLERDLINTTSEF